MTVDLNHCSELVSHDQIHSEDLEACVIIAIITHHLSNVLLFAAAQLSLAVRAHQAYLSHLPAPHGPCPCLA